MWRLRPILIKCKDKITMLLDKIPRKVQVLVNLLLIALLIFLLYIFQGRPCFTLEQAYRRLEKANLVGPAEILGVEEADGVYTKQVVIAETEDAVILSQIYQLSSHTYEATQLFYVEKCGEITVTPAPRDLHWRLDEDQLCMTMIVFDEYPQAVRAEIDFSVYWEYWENENKVRYENTYQLKSKREKTGYFRFDLPFTHNKYEVAPAAEAIFQLSQVFYYPTDWTPPADAYPATVRLFDAAGQLIVEKKLHLHAQFIG